MNMDQSELTPRKKHSVLGIASLASALLFIVIFVLWIIILQFNTSGAPTTTLQITFNQILSVCVFILNPLSVVLGIIALFQKNTKKLFPILGIGFSFVCCLLMVLAIVYGLISTT